MGSHSCFFGCGVGNQAEFSRGKESDGLYRGSEKLKGCQGSFLQGVYYKKNLLHAMIC